MTGLVLVLLPIKKPTPRSQISVPRFPLSLILSCLLWAFWYIPLPCASDTSQAVMSVVCATVGGYQAAVEHT